MKSRTIILILFVFILSFLPSTGKGSDRGLAFTLKPRDVRILEVLENGAVIDLQYQNNSFSPVIQKSIQFTPLWLQEELRTQFTDLQNRPIITLDGARLAVGDINSDGMSDLLIGDAGGSIQIFTNQGIPHSMALKRDSILQFDIWKGKQINPALLPFEEAPHLFVGVGHELFLLHNKKEKGLLSLSDPELIYTETLAEGETDNLSPCVFQLGDSTVIAIGHKDGSLSLLRNKDAKWTGDNNLWTKDTDFFKTWKEQWGETEEPKGIKVNANACPAILALPDLQTKMTQYLLAVGSDDGKISLFQIREANSTYIVQTWPQMETFQSMGRTAPAFMDVNGDTRIDLVFSTAGESVSYLLNNGTNEKISFQILKSNADKNPLNDFFGGSGYYRDFDRLFASGYNQEVCETVASFLLSVKAPYKDEVAYCLANLQTEDIVSYVNNKTLYLLEENVKGIYELAEKVPYVKVKELLESTTLIYNTDSGWKDMPQDIYYNYLVMLNRYLMVPNGFEKLYEKNFFRSYLPYDTTYEKTLYDAVKNAKTLYEAAYQVMSWLKVDIGGVWHTGDKPKGWYNIYKNLLNMKVGIWCGEWSIMYEAAARAVNIPTIIIVAMGEDHQFNNFWADSWHHVDPSAGESKVKDSWAPYFDDSLAYYKNWGKRIFSWPMEWEGNGKYDHVWRSELPYNPPELLSNLTFSVTDKEGTAVDGARVELWSHWPMEGKYQPIPFISAIGYTDSTGKAVIEKVGHQNFTAIVVSRIGTVQFYVTLPHKGNYSFPVNLPGTIPALYPFQTIKKSNIDWEKAVKRWEIIPGDPTKGEPFQEPKTKVTYVSARNFADFMDIKEIKWEAKKHTLTLIKKGYIVEFTEKSKLILVNGEKKELQDYPLVIRSNKSFLDINPLAELYGLKVEYDVHTHEITLSVALVTEKQINIEIDQFEQKNYHMIDVYNTRLQYVDYWRQKTGSAEVYVLSGKELANLLAGKPIERADKQSINTSTAFRIQTPDFNPEHEKYYLVFWNPNFATSMQVKIK